MKVTLKDIAEETGYSISTISRVLSNAGKISTRASKKIVEAANRLNYPLSKIQGYEQNNLPHNVAVIADFHEGEFYASYFYGFLKAARSENIRLSLLNVSNPRKDARAFLKEIIEEGYYDSVILFMPELEHHDYENIVEVIPDTFPVVSNALIENPLLSTITFDGYSAGYQAADHFYNQGYKNLGIVKGPSFKAETRFRYNGFNDFINTKPEMNLVWESEGDFEFDSGVRSFKNLMESNMQVDAVFVSNDLMATAFLAMSQIYNVKIPDDLAILGSADLPMCQQTIPVISSIKTDFERLGTATIQTLKTRFSPTHHQHGILSMIPVKLIPRSSSIRKSESVEQVPLH